MLTIANNSALAQVIYSSIGLFFVIFGAMAAAVSVGLIVCSDKVFRIFDVLNVHISTRRKFRALAILRDTSPLIMKYRHWFTGFIVAGSVYALVGIAAFDDAKIAAWLHLSYPLPFVIWIIKSARVTLMALSIFSLMIGVMLSFFPQALATIEKPLNRWYSMRVLIYELERTRLGVDNFVAVFPKAIGLVILFPALVLMITFGFRLA